MMGQIEDDFVQYVFHLQVVVDSAPQNLLGNVQYSAPSDPVEGSSSIASAMAAEAQAGGLEGPPEEFVPNEPQVTQEPIRVEKTPGRNEPCFCGSGKKYKLCHGR
jgi:preprotein translocase subunit SecA